MVISIRVVVSRRMQVAVRMEKPLMPVRMNVRDIMFTRGAMTMRPGSRDDCDGEQPAAGQDGTNSIHAYRA